MMEDLIFMCPFSDPPVAVLRFGSTKLGNFSEGESVLLECHSKGNPAPNSIIWFHQVSCLKLKDLNMKGLIGRLGITQDFASPRSWFWLFPILSLHLHLKQNDFLFNLWLL